MSASASTASNNATQAAGLLGDAAIKKSAEKKEPRTMLKNQDTVMSKCLNPYGASVVDEVPLENLWNIVCKGDQWAKFFTELAATPDNCKDHILRENIGFSRYCETMCNAILDWLAAEDLRSMMKESVVEKIDLEAKALLPHFQRLNSGKRPWDKDKGDTFAAWKNAKRQRLEAPSGGAASAPAADAPTVEASVEKILEFIKLGTDSNLRMAIQFLSGGGVFFAAQTFDKTARAWVEHKVPTPSKESIVAGHNTRALSEASKPKADVKWVKEKATGTLLR